MTASLVFYKSVLSLAMVLFGASGFYLTLIARFYRQKFRKGPNPRSMQAGLGAMVLGLLLGTWLPWSAAAFSILGFSALGTLVFLVTAWSLHRTMMSTD